MWRFLLVVMVVASTPTLMAQTESQSNNSPFHPAETVSVTDITVPVAGNGTVVLNVVISDKGEAQKVEVRRDIDVLTPLAVQAVRDWKFSPATLNGKAVISRMPVAVTFRPPGSAAPVPLPTLIPQSDAAIQADFQPAEVTRAGFPRYPATTVVAGAVVLEVTVTEKGEAEEIKVLRDLPPLTDEAKDVVGNFRFMAATFNGRPIHSKIVLAFVSQPLAAPLSMTFGSTGSCHHPRGR
jgi:outer membrane biosynthesis protein TonB